MIDVLDTCNHPTTIVTKSAGILRDLDRLASMAERGLVQVGISVTTLDSELSRLMEPRCSSPARRLEAIAALSDAGIPVRVMASPMIPGLNDSELETILARSREAGARAASMIPLRLPLEVRRSSATGCSPTFRIGRRGYEAGDVDARRQGLRRHVR